MASFGSQHSHSPNSEANESSFSANGVADDSRILEVTVEGEIVDHIDRSE